MKVLILMLLVLINVSAYGCGDGDTKVGYWWYCEPKPSDSEQTPQRAPLPPPPTHKEMMKMHPDDLSVMQEKYLKEAVWQTTPQNVLNYYQILDVTRRKSLAFMNVTNLVMLKNPELNAYGQYAKTTAERQALNKHKSAQLHAALAHYKNEFGLVLFTQRTCIFCRNQHAILAHFSDRHGWPIKTIDIDRNPTAAARFNITTVPVTLVAKKGSEQWMPVAVGQEALTTIESNVYRAIRFLRGDTSPNQFLQMEHEDGTIADPDRTFEGNL